MLNDETIAERARALFTEKQGSGSNCSAHSLQRQMGSQDKITDAKVQLSSQSFQRKDVYSGLDLQSVSPSAPATARKRRVHLQVCDLTNIFISSNWYIELSYPIILFFSILQQWQRHIGKKITYNTF